MAELRGYTCDGGCGASTVLDRPVDMLARQGWFTTYTPDGYPTLHTCSASCLVRALERIGWRGALDRA